MNEEIDLVDLFRTIRDNMRMIVMIVVTCLILSSIYLLLVPNVYQSTAVLHVMPREIVSDKGEVYTESPQQLQQRMNTYVEVIKNQEKATQVGEQNTNHFLDRMIGLSNNVQSDVKIIKNTELIEVTTIGGKSEEAKNNNDKLLKSFFLNISVNGDDQKEQVTGTIKVVKPSTLSLQPIKPRKVLTILLATIIGIIIGCSYAIFTKLWKPKICTAADVQNCFHAPLLGIISCDNKHKGNKK